MQREVSSMDKRGVSMISLVIIVIVTIILIALAVGAGYRYIDEGNKLKAQTLSSIIGSNAYKRQNDVNSGTTTSYYEGYFLDIDKLKENRDKFLGIPTDDIAENDGAGDGMYDCLQKEDSMWYLIDAESATNLGADNAENLLTRNISYEINNIPEDGNNIPTLKLVLVDYMYGQSYYVTVPADVVKECLRYSSSTCPLSPDGKHRFTIATCVDDSECIYGCGTDEGPRALGHKWISATCTAAGYCERCNVINPDDSEPLGHLFISNSQVSNATLVAQMEAKNCMMFEDTLSDEAWIADAEKHWHECIRCGIKKVESKESMDGNASDNYIGDGSHFFIQENGKSFISYDDTYHYQQCRICGWYSIKSKHDLERIEYDPTTGSHAVACKLCDYKKGHNLSAWQPDHPESHYRFCNYCIENNIDDALTCNTQTITVGTVVKHVAYIEAHYDNVINETGASGHDYICDACNRHLDTIPPLNFNVESGNDYTYARVKEINGVKQITTSQVTVEAFTIDRESGVQYYQFGIDNGHGGVNWDPTKYMADSSSYVATHTFKNLDMMTEYTFYVRAYDNNNNVNVPGKVVATTLGFPNFNGVKNVPDPYVKAGDPRAIIGVKDVDTSIPNIKITYRHRNGEWSTPVPIEEIDTIKITLALEDEHLEFKFIDDKEGSSTPNESGISVVDLSVIDNTAPSIRITEKVDDDPDLEAQVHHAVVTVSDERSGIAPRTVITYGWNTSNTIQPVTTSTHTTTNLDTASSYTFEINTPTNVKGIYYLWIYEGVLDAAGNATDRKVVGSIAFNIDDIRPELTNIKMFNANPAVPGEDLFVKTGGTVTVTFTASKELKQDPIVRIDDIDASRIRHDGLEYTCTFPISTSYEEGILYLFIGDVVAENGRMAVSSYDNDDLVKGPVRYDRTLPVLEYIPKKVD